MPTYQAPLRDMQFLLNDVFDAEALWRQLGLSEESASLDLANAVLEEAAKIAGEAVSPVNQPGHEQGVTFDNGSVTTPEGFVEAYRTLAEGGWVGVAGEPDFGGQGLPKMLTLLVDEMVAGASVSMHLYLMLTAGAAIAINAHASEELKATYLPKLYSGEWAGTMCLTEPHAGTDLGLIRTQAQPRDDGSYAISGTKIFITSGEHDLTDNIIHLVLAKLPDAPAGPRGISLFLVPKYKLNADGSLGERNAVTCGSIEHKMGINASSTCVMNFDGAEGYLVGELNRGLNCMFTMMNYERLTVGIQGLGASAAALQFASEYATERLQGRGAGSALAAGQAESILVHPDVRRMLLTQRALVEGGRAFAVFAAEQLDRAKFGSGTEAAKAEKRAALLTPIAKAFLTDNGLDCCVLAQQVFGGHGYVREWGVEQLVRDVRITQIYEGTNGVQAIDLVGRKVLADGGAVLRELLDEARAFAASCDGQAAMTEFCEPLLAALERLQVSTDWVIEHSAEDPQLPGAVAVPYLAQSGYTLFAWLWARMARSALANESDRFCQRKLHTARFFMRHLLPKVEAFEREIRCGSEALMAPAQEDFLL